MLKRIIRFLKGYLYAEVSGRSNERFFSLCKNKNLNVWNITSCKNIHRFYVDLYSFRCLRPIARKTKSHIRIRQKSGLPFFINKYKKRKFFVIGFMLAIIIVFVLKIFIWEIDIQGNYKVTDESIAVFLEKNNVRAGTNKYKINCSKIEEKIRNHFDNITWVSVSLEGSYLNIKLQEGINYIEKNKKNKTSILAKKSGVIMDIITRNGTPLVEPGDKVKKGQKLVSNIVEIKNDSGDVVDRLKTTADANVIARTKYKYEEILYFDYKKKCPTGKDKNQLCIKWNDVIYQLGTNKNNYKTYDVFIHNNTSQSLLDALLNVSFQTINVKEYKFLDSTYTREEVVDLCNEKFNSFLNKKNKQIIELISHDVKIYMYKDKAITRGTIVVLEDIGIDF